MITPDREGAAYRQLAAVSFAKLVLPSEAELKAIIDAAATPRTAGELLNEIPRERHPQAFRMLVWLHKMHVLQLVAP